MSAKEKGAYFKIKEPSWNWERIGGLSEAKERLEEMVSVPLRHPEAFERAGTMPPSGILMWGPPGGGKTVLAEASAKSAGSGYVSVKAIEIMSEPEEIREMYRAAARLAPCVVFINEVDALAPIRDAESSWLSGITRDAPFRIAPEDTTEILYEELDKASKKPIITLGATYRPDVLDPQILKKGRLERKVYIPAPDLEERLDIIEKSLAHTAVSEEVDLKKLARETECYVGADIRGLIREATVLAIKEKGGTFEKVESKHFREARRRVPPSLSPQTVAKYGETLKNECDHCYTF